MTKKKKAKQWRMTVDKEVFNTWQKYKRHGDTKALAAELNLSYPVLNRAIKYGFVTMEGLTNHISNYFTKRLEREGFNGIKA